METPKPGPEHRKLEQMAGVWASKEKMHPSQWDPKGGTADGHIRNRIALGGFIMTGDYGQEREGKTTFEGHSVFTYDKNERCYLLYWWDSMGMSADVFRGNFEGSNLVMTSRNAMGHFRLTYEFPDLGKMRSKMEMSEDERAGERCSNRNRHARIDPDPLECRGRIPGMDTGGRADGRRQT